MRRISIAVVTAALLLSTAIAQDGAAFRLQIEAPLLFTNAAGGETPEAAAIAFTAIDLIDAYVGGSVSLDLAALAVLPQDAAFGIADVAWSLTTPAGSPLSIAGLTLSPNGVLSGSPTGALDVEAVLHASHPDAEGALPFRIVIGPALDADVANIVAAMTVQPDADRRDAIGDLVADLKSAGVWQEMDVLYVMAAHDRQAARINWRSPAQHMLATGANILFNVDEGLATPSDGGSITSSWTPSTGPNLGLSDAHVGGWNHNGGGVAAVLAYSSSPTTSMTSLRSGSNQYPGYSPGLNLNSNSPIQPVNNGSPAGYWLGNRNGSSYNLRLNDVQLGAGSSAPKGVSTGTVSILWGSNAYDTTVSIVHLGGYLDAAKSSAAHVAFANYMGRVKI